jgi:hypothetical protein
VLIHTTYTVRTVPVLLPDPQAGFASGRVEDPDLFHKKIHVVNFFVKQKRTMLPQANRDSIG